MIYDLNELNYLKEIEIDENIEIDDNLDKRILDLKNSFVNGRIYINSQDEVVLDCIFNGTMIIEDSISLKSVPYEFSINIEENLEEIKENYLNAYEISKNTLDLRSILWQNIVLEVPISYSLEKDAKLKGDGWELVGEKEVKDEIDPRLKKLEDLLKGDD